MSDLTPIEKLDNAVREFISEAGDWGTLSGWVLSYELQDLTTEDGVAPLITANGYTLSPATTLAPAMGLARQLVRRLDSIFDIELRDEDDDELA